MPLIEEIILHLKQLAITPVWPLTAANTGYIAHLKLLNFIRALKIDGAVFVNEEYRLMASIYFNLENVQMDKSNINKLSYILKKWYKLVYSKK